MAWTAALLFVLLAVSASAQSPAPGPSSESDACQDAIFADFAACLDFVDPANNTAPPLKGECCQGVGNFLTKSPQCICDLLKTNVSDLLPGLPVDRAKAVNLPAQCRKKLPAEALGNCLGSAASPTAKKCFPAVAEQLIPCLSYVDPAGNGTAPTVKGACCAGVRGFLKQNESCLCSLINANSSALPIPLDRAKVLTLPRVCQAELPSFKCDGDVTTKAPPNPCLMPVLNSLAPCVNYVDPTSTSNATATADGDCCKGIRSFLSTETTCVCSIVNAKPGEYPIAVDQAKAISLATETCKASTAQIRQCLGGESSPTTSAPAQPSNGNPTHPRVEVTSAGLVTAFLSIAAALL